MQHWIEGWRAPAIVCVIAAICALAGVFTLPPLDRDESRFAQATAQMLETGDFVRIEFQDEPRHKKPVGVHWLQVASVRALGDPGAREAWADLERVQLDEIPRQPALHEDDPPVGQARNPVTPRRQGLDAHLDSGLSGRPTQATPSRRHGGRTAGSAAARTAPA